MALTAFITEDAGRTWHRPNHGIWRDRGNLLAQNLTFAHRFATDDAIVAASPLVDTAAVERWIADVQQRCGARVHTLATTPGGKPVRAVEVGNPDAPMVYMQSGQHSMMERIGLHVAGAAFEHAATDTELMRRSRWVLVPVVNMDSYAVQPRPDDRNMNRLWGKSTGHHTVDPIGAWITAQAARTGAPLLLDFHSGVTWRGHYALAPKHPANDRLRHHLQQAGLAYSFSLDRLPSSGDSGVFSDWAASLPGAGPSLTVELAVVAAMTAHAPALVDIDSLRDDGRRWKHAITTFITA
jgi:predicted deacylase